MLSVKWVVMRRMKKSIDDLCIIGGCLKIEISFHFVILNGVKDLESDAHEIDFVERCFFAMLRMTLLFDRQFSF